MKICLLLREKKVQDSMGGRWGPVTLTTWEGQWEDVGVQSTLTTWEGSMGGRGDPVTVTIWEGSMGGRGGPVTVTTWEGSMGGRGSPVTVTTWEESMGGRWGSSHFDDLGGVQWEDVDVGVQSL